ncbi:RNA-directed DNA polymerase, eukaryota, reverse transcriptase zinc-binding domain protein, partial [Tanacetum coccineum]
MNTARNPGENENNKEKKKGVADKQNMEDNENPPSLENIWRIHTKDLKELKKSANKYAVLSTEEDMHESINYDDRAKVDWYVLRKHKPKDEEMVDWTYDMKEYLKHRWEALNSNDVDRDEENEGYELKQKDAIAMIKDENLQVCAFIETHLKTNSIGKVGNRAFSTWNWCSNVHHSSTSCRILLGWNDNLIKTMVITMSRQSVLCCIETIHTSIKFYCSIVYASNNSTERRSLWKELEGHKNFAGQHPWVIVGDFNVALKIEEHSVGMSHRSSDMQEFFDAINNIEVEDICSSGFHFTWTKSLKNPNCLTLKKLDRIMVNEEFLKQYNNAHGIFLPYGISDHSPAQLVIQKGFIRKNNAFRFSNFTASKQEFLDTVKEVWKQDVYGCHMYRLVKKMKNLKKPLKALSSRHGNVYERTKSLKE